jgi:hypothetical protein
VAPASSQFLASFCGDCGDVYMYPMNFRRNLEIFSGFHFFQRLLCTLLADFEFSSNLCGVLRCFRRVLIADRFLVSWLEKAISVWLLFLIGNKDILIKDKYYFGSA